MKQHFTYEITSLVRMALQIFIDKHNEIEKDKSKIMASNEVVYNLLTDNDIEDLLSKWSELNNDKITLFENGLDDAKQMWDILWETEMFKDSLGKHICKGFSGSGVYDKTTNKFYPCIFAHHYDAIKIVLESSHPELWKQHQDFIWEKTTDCSEVDNFIMNELVLVGNRYEKDYYTVSERQY